MKKGSSPHTWRIQIDTFIENHEVRIISTYVENTTEIFDNDNVDKDHLHIRGEYLIATALIDGKSGSSPHTWRILAKYYSKWVNLRIISTYVENT